MGTLKLCDLAVYVIFVFAGVCISAHRAVLFTLTSARFKKKTREVVSKIRDPSTEQESERQSNVTTRHN